MRIPLKYKLYQHIEEHASLYLFSFVLFMMGIIFGTLTIHSLGYTQRTELFEYFQQFMMMSKEEEMMKSSYALSQNFIHYMKFTGAIWILGLSIIGLPIILLLLFLKGLFIGFTVGFLVYQLGWQGVLFSFVSIIPQNMIVVPILLIMSVISISFSIKLIAHLFGSHRAHQRPNLSKYIGSILVSTVILFIVSLYETYLSPFFTNIVS